MRNEEANGAAPAHQRITEILRTAMSAPEEDTLEDETRRLMLHLSIEPPGSAAPGSSPAQVPPPTPRRGLLRRIFGGAERSAGT